MNVDGWIDESNHQEFWELMPFEVQRDHHAIASIISELDRIFLVATRFQRNVWMSAQKSLRAQQFIKVAGYQQLEQEISDLLRTEDYIEQSRVAIENANNILRAAAYQTPMKINGVPKYITEELIDSVLSGIEGSLDRVFRLFSPIWTNKVNKYVFDDAHVRILWHGSFRKELGQYTVESGGRFTVISLSHQLSGLDSVGVNFVRTNARWAVPAASAISTASSSLSAIGISEPDVLASRWRSRVAAEGAG